MIFTEFRFLFFFGIVFLVYWSLKENHSRKTWLLLCSYLFYSFWDWRFLGLILVSTLLDYLVGLGIEKTQSKAIKKILLLCSIAGNLGILGVFKYYDFFVESGAILFEWLSIPFSVQSLHLILPVGISFYTFQTLSYSIDVYSGKLRATKSLLDFALFVGFFPQLVAGPIERASNFLPQLKSKKSFNHIKGRYFILLFLVGFFKKACVADQLALLLDPYFQNPKVYSALSSWIAIFGYATQLYCDFSGYTDMAIACAGVLGYQLQKNFDFPYFSRNMRSFWQRWHISLSSWFRDYIYIPLGGRHPNLKLITYRNVIITMALCGLWHGASYNFILWGLLHAFFMIFFGNFSFSISPRFKKIAECMEVRFTFFLFFISLVFFRIKESEVSLIVLKDLIGYGHDGGKAFPDFLVGVLVILSMIHFLSYRGFFKGWANRVPLWLFTCVCGLFVSVLLATAQVEYKPFIYFQF